MGDKIGLRVFQDDRQVTAGALVFERLDLSGVFEVEEAGTIAVPAIRRVEAAGLTLPCLETAVQNRLADLLGAEVTVTASYAARPPVLIRGSVVAPGLYAYAPGLTVEAVLAQSGGDGGGLGTAAGRLSLKARHEELLSLRASLRLELAALNSLSLGNDTLQLGAATQADVSERLGAARIDGEQAALSAALRAERAHQVLDAADVAALENSIISAGARLREAQVQRGFFKQREATLAATLQGECRDRCQEGRRAIQAQLDTVGWRLMDLELLVLEKSDALERLIHAKQSRESGAALTAAERQRDITLRIRDMMSELGTIDAQVLSIATQRGVTGMDAGADAGKIAGIGAGKNEPAGITVLRAVDGSQIVYQASHDMRLQPGDIVTVEAALADNPLTDSEKIDLVTASQ